MGKSSLSFSSNKNVFILPPLLRDIFDGFKISGWLTLFFQHWKKDTPLSSSLYYFWWKLSVHSYYCSLMYDTMCLPPPQLLLKCSLYVWFSAIWLDVLVWFSFLLCLEFVDLHRFVKFIVQILIKFGNLSTIISLNIFLLQYLFSLGFNLHTCSTIQCWQGISEACSFFFSPVWVQST